MLFSIITICFNSEKTIERTIKSVLNQTYKDYEYIIVDGGSTDGTMEIIKRYQALFGDKLRVISEEDRGIYDAMNKGIRMSKGRIIGIVNSDDYYENDTLAKVSGMYRGYDYTIIYGLIRCVMEEKEVMVYLKNPEFLEQDMIAHPACFITKKVYDEYGVYSLEYPYSADYEFMLRIRKEKEICFVGIYEILSNFSMDGASSSIKGYRDTLKLKKKYGIIENKLYYREMIKSWPSMQLKNIISVIKNKK